LKPDHGCTELVEQEANGRDLCPYSESLLQDDVFKSTSCNPPINYLLTNYFLRPFQINAANEGQALRLDVGTKETIDNFVTETS
jgi:hypothetical protein